MEYTEAMQNVAEEALSVNFGTNPDDVVYMEVRAVKCAAHAAVRAVLDKLPELPMEVK